MTPTRRQLLAGASATLLPPAALAANGRDRDLRAMLDQAASATDPAGAADRLARIDPATLSPAPRLDLLTALSGLRIDAELARDVPDPAAPMSSARYRLLLRRLSSDDAEPGQALHRLEQEHRTLSARADRLLRGIGLRSGSVGARYTALVRNPRWLYGDDDAGRDRAIADMARTLVLARAEALKVISFAPAYCFDVTVRRLSAAEQAAGKGGYRELPTPTEPGAYVVDLKDIRRRPSWTLPSVVRHELLPGHMIQLPLEARADPHPLRLRYALGFAEGWAIHAERRALNAGAYAGEPMAELGCLHWLLFRVCRALIDLRMHLSGWSPDHARAQLIEWHGEPAYFAPFDADIARIAREPALRVAEALAWLMMDDLAAQDQMAFHRVALEHGRMRLDLMRALVAGRRFGKMNFP